MSARARDWFAVVALLALCAFIVLCFVVGAIELAGRVL